MQTVPVVPDRKQSQLEELANSVSHGLGVVAALVGIPFLIMAAAQQGETRYIIGVSVFSATIILLYLGSTLYHALPAGKTKGVFRLLDHAAIYLLIAGTYTPFTLGVLRGPWGWTLFGVVWGLAAVGVLLKGLGKAQHPFVSTALYVAMGWLIVVAVGPLIARVPAPGLIWLIAGGLFYTAGVGFFATDSRLRFGHLIWHLFVLAGTACHYFAVLWYAA